MYLSHGGSIRFAAGFIAGVLLREAANRKGKRPPRSLLVPAGGRNGGGDDGGKGEVLVRQLETADFDKGFLGLLGQLTSVGTVTKENFLERLVDIRAGPEYVFVVEENGKIVATGTLLVERKFARGCGLCGHIEDIVVDAGQRGRGMGALTRVAERLGCYKVILDCSEANQPFYEKCGLKRKEVQMAKYFLDP